MPSVAINVCQDCGSTDTLILLNRHMLTTMPPCSCGGRMQVTRIVYDRRVRQEPVLHKRRASDAQPTANGKQG